MDSKDIAARCRCCACGGPIGRRVNLVDMAPRLAAWKYPTGGNVLTGEYGYAIAVICDGCVNRKTKIKDAVEFRGDETIYHAIDSLAVDGVGAAAASSMVDGGEDDEDIE